MESLIQEIYDEIGSCQLNNLKNEILKNEHEIEKLEKSYPRSFVEGHPNVWGDPKYVARVEQFNVAYNMCMDVQLRDKERLNLQLERFNKNNEDVTQVKSTNLMDLPECNYVAIHNKLTLIKSETIKNKEEITKLKSLCPKTGHPAACREWETKSNPWGGPHADAVESLLRYNERLKVQLDQTNKIWEKYNDEVTQKKQLRRHRIVDTHRITQNHEIEQLKVCMADTQCIVQNHEIEQLKISVADTQRIAQNHEIEQLKVTMALMIKSQEKLELKNKELEEQIKEATDRQNQRWWQRS